MASAPPPTDLQQEAKCPICLECLTDPVMLNCGHSFGRGCITKYYKTWEALGEVPQCPICKVEIQKQKFRPNWQLANVVEKIKDWTLNTGKEDLCLNHKEKLHLFCKEDETFVCLICEKSPEHKGHTMLILEEAAQQYKSKIFNCLETLRTEREKIQIHLADAENESQEMLKITASERQKTAAAFKTLHQLLKKYESHLLAQIEEVEKEIARKRDEHLANLSEELSSLESLIHEMEEKHQQPVSELLQDVRSTLQRYRKKETFQNREAFPSEAKWRLWRCCEISPFLEGVIKKFSNTLASGLPLQRAHVMLNPASASSHLVLSEDQRGMTWRRRAQDLFEDPENCYGFVLGCAGFTEGYHFWDVLVGSGNGWAVGVASKSVKGKITLTPEEGIWAVGRWKGQYKAFIKGINPPLTLREELRSIRVCLNYTGGRIVFFDTDKAALLYAFSEAPFSGQTLYPFFAVYDKGHIRLIRPSRLPYGSCPVL